MEPSASGPLKGIRVLDFGAYLAGSYHATLMGDMGADVIKVEPLTGDPTRLTPPFVGGESRVFIGWNRNKRGLVIDIRNEAGLNAVYDLVRGADVVTTNFRPKAAKKLKVDYDTFSALNPKLVYCAATGFGAKGPLSDQPSYDGIFQAMGGVAQANKITTGNVAIAAPVFIDIHTALLGLAGITAALFHRERTGEGQLVETSLLQGVMSVQPAQYCRAMEQEEEGVVGAYPYTIFETKDGHIFVGAPQEKYWHSFCQVIGLPALAEDVRYGSLADRVKRREELGEILQPVMREKSTDTWEALLMKDDVPCGAVRTSDEFMNHPQVAANNMKSVIHHPKIGPIQVFGVPINFEKTPGNIQRAAPMLGEHTREILRELGYDDERIEKLRSDEAIA